MATFTPFDPLTGSLTSLVSGLLATNSGVVVDSNSISLRLSGPGALSFYDASAGLPLGIGAGLLLTSGTTPGTSNTSTWFGSDNSGASGFANGDVDIDAVVNTVFQTMSYDATTLGFSFNVTNPANTSVSFDLVFGSDEYPEWVDAFVDSGIVIVDGVNYALFNNDPLHPLSVISPNLSAGYFQDNGANVIPIEYDGVSGKLRIVAPLKAGQATHTIKIGIADTGDHILDSGLFIANLSAGTDPGSGVVSNPGGGTSGNDTCTGSGKDEYFDLKAGDDQVFAGGGNDIVVAGAGNDSVYGGSGNDDLKGDSGNDLLDGGADLDTAVYGGASGGYTLSYDALTNQTTIDGTAQGEGLDVLVGVEQVKFSDGLFTLSAGGLAPVGPPPPPATNLPGAVVITGLAAVGKTLQATVIDADGLPAGAGAIAYQWTANGALIAGATGSSYVVQSSNIGATLGVEAVYNDAKGNAETAIASGVYVLPPSDGDLAVTLMAIEGPAVANVHTPITTLLERAVELGETPASATQKIRSALNVPAAVKSLLSTNAFQILTTGVGDTTTALALAKLQVQVEVICSLNDDQSGVKMALALLNKAASGGSFDLTKAADLCTILDLNPSAFNLADKTTYPQPLREIIDRTSNIKAATKLFGATDSKSIEHEWVDFLSNWDSLPDQVLLSGTSVAINQGPSGFASAPLPNVAAGDAITLTASQLITGITDPDNDPLLVSWLTTDHGDWFAANGDGSWSLDPNAAGYDPAYLGPLEITYTVEDGQGHSLTATQMLVVVDHVNQAPTGSVTISGVASQGQTLSAANTLADLDGLGPISYQWKANGAAISGANGSTYLLKQAEVGKAITVTASYTDGFGAAEAVTSATTSAVANVNDAPTGSVTISGVASLGQTLSAANSLADLDGLGPISYQWKADGTSISGANGSTYLLQAAEVGKAITVTASYTDGYGAAEAVTSAATGLVSDINLPPAPQGIGVSGSVLTLRFSEAISAQSVPASLFPIALVSSTGTVTTPTISSIAVSGTDNTRLLITLASAPASTLDVRVGYNDPTGNQTSGVVEDLTGLDLPSFANQFATSFSSAATVTTLATNYLDLTLTGTAAINGTGNNNANTLTGNSANNVLSGGAGNDLLVGGAGADTLVGGTGADVLTGGTGGAGDTTADTFKLGALNESLLASFDRITDLVIGTDKIDGPTSVSAANLKEGLGAVTDLTQSAIQAVLTSTSFAKSGAATFTFGGGTATRTFLALNDSTAGFSATSDAIVEITGYSGLLSNLAVI
ncbi:MAG: choice-of-anchor L domain-containing protein [Cyanobacteriota bacterium]|jgi:Ca2+-binding RTX toxin-like protein